MKKLSEINWDGVGFWIFAIVLIFVIVYLFATGRAFK
jgi:hypothetical protein